MLPVYYNEWHEPAAEWIRELIRLRQLPDGDIDTRSIRDVSADDLQGYRQCHFFAGIGGWPLAIRKAGLEGVYGLWTGSPPCQPFSVAGKQKAQEDERHLAPVWLDLLVAGRPQYAFGEQVWAAVRTGWLDDLFDAAEREGYACGAAGLPACSVGAPHIRDRLYFGMAHSNNTGRQGRARVPECADEQPSGARGMACGVADTDRKQHDRSGHTGPGRRNEHSDGVQPGRMADADFERCDGIDPLLWENTAGRNERNIFETARSGAPIGACPDEGRWHDPDWLSCRDGKWRPVEPGTFPLADGVSTDLGSGSDIGSALDLLRKAPQAWRTERLRGYGNAIVPDVAVEFIQAFMRCSYGR